MAKLCSGTLWGCQSVKSEPWSDGSPGIYFLSIPSTKYIFGFKLSLTIYFLEVRKKNKNLLQAIYIICIRGKKKVINVNFIAVSFQKLEFKRIVFLYYYILTWMHDFGKTWSHMYCCYIWMDYKIANVQWLIFIVMLRLYFLYSLFIIL
jgi:hypothetical protein